MPGSETPQRGVKSVDVTARLLVALARSRGSLSLSELSLDAGVSPSRAHAYAVGMIKARLVEQSQKDKRYRLGPVARALGTAAVVQFDPFEIADSAADELRNLTNLSVALAVWHASGPVIVRWSRGVHHLPIHVGVGSTLPISTTALGQVFLAHLPEKLTDRLLTRELAELDKPAAAELRVKLAEQGKRIRAQGYASVKGTLFPQMCALAAPVLQDDRTVLASLSLMGMNNFREVGGERKTINALLRVTERASRQLAGVLQARNA